MTCENGLSVGFKSKTNVTIGVKNGRPHVITIQPSEYIDIDVKSGKFFVKNKFTDSKMKLVSPDTDQHSMDTLRIKPFLSMVDRADVSDKITN